MNYFVCLAMMAVIVAVASANPVNQHLETENKSLQVDSQGGDYTRVRKSANYGNPTPSSGASGIPAPPCPKNYLFSCQPSLAPVACSGASGANPQPVSPPGYYPIGAHSTYVPTYMAPYVNNYAVRESYNGFAPQPIQHYHQY